MAASDWRMQKHQGGSQWECFVSCCTHVNFSQLSLNLANQHPENVRHSVAREGVSGLLWSEKQPKSIRHPTKIWIDICPFKRFNFCGKMQRPVKRCSEICLTFEIWTKAKLIFSNRSITSGIETQGSKKMLQSFWGRKDFFDVSSWHPKIARCCTKCTGQ